MQRRQWIGSVLAALAASQSWASGTSDDAQARILDGVRRAVLETAALEGLDSRTCVWTIEPRMIAPNAVELLGETSEASALARLVAGLGGIGAAVRSRVDILPDRADLREQVWALAARPVVSVRSTEAKEGARQVDELILGMPARVLKRTAAGVLLQTPSARVGWADAEALRAATDTTLLAWNRHEKIASTGKSTAVRLEGTDAAALELPAGAVMEVVESSAEDWLVRLPDGRRARVRRADAELLEAREIREEDRRRSHPEQFLADIAKTARSLAGRPYRSGGWTDQGFDEVGFVRAAFFRHDLILPSEMDQLARMGRPLSGGRRGRDLKAGDLVFFGTPARGERGPEFSSLGMALGRGEFLEVVRSREGEAALRRGSFAKPRRSRGAFLWAVRIEVADMRHPYLYSTRTHGFYQAPPAQMRAHL